MNATIQPDLAQRISSLITSRSVASSMVDAVLKAEPFTHDEFVYWVQRHREASLSLCEMGIQVLTYDDPTRLDEEVAA